MRLSAPTFVVFVITVIIAIVAALTALNLIPNISVPSVWIMAVAYVVLALACILKGA